MNILTSYTDFILLFLSILTLIIIFFIVFYLLISKKIKEEKYVVLKVSQEFEENLRKTTEEELRKIVFELKEKVNNFSNQTILNYEKELSEFIKNLEKEFIALSLLSKEEHEKLIRKNEENAKIIENQINIEILKFNEIYNEIKNYIKAATKKEIELLTKNLNKEMNNILKSTEEILAKKIIEAEKNIEDYKKRRLAEVDKKIFRLIGDVSKIIIGESLEIATHEKLVIESLEKAKKEYFFT